tara:strand:+ start:6434 stop:6697 length:264 start_codon:yes stop_codon:yes gene_type:complete
MIIRQKIIATVDVLYWMPDYTDILQEFMWQTEDIKPYYPRVHKFLTFWKENIDAVIAEVQIADSPITEYRNAKDYIRYGERSITTRK